MRLQTAYEWTREEIDENGDVIDCDFSDELPDFWDLNEPGYDHGLVRKTGNDEIGIDDILYAYIKDGRLPEFFTDSAGYETGYRVPARFHNELKRKQ